MPERGRNRQPTSGNPYESWVADPKHKWFEPGYELPFGKGDSENTKGAVEVAVDGVAEMLVKGEQILDWGVTQEVSLPGGFVKEEVRITVGGMGKQRVLKIEVREKKS